MKTKQYAERERPADPAKSVIRETQVAHAPRTISARLRRKLFEISC